MSTKVILIRHGQTAWNKEERYRGRTDLPLDQVGLRQAELAAAHLAGAFRPVALFSSPLQRAVQTARPIAQRLGLQVGVAQGLIDLDYGDWSGLTPEDAEARFPLAYGAWLDAPDTVCFPHGEALGDVHTRAMDLVQHLVATYPAGQVVLVTHLIVCRVLLCALLDLPLSHIWRFQVDTASLTVFDVSANQASLLTSNQTYHLRQASPL